MKRSVNSVVILATIALVGTFMPLASANEPNPLTEKATFGAGCFWGVEAAFRQVKGVTATAVGYMGGTLKNPTYQDVCSDQTGHAEVVEVEYDPSQVSYEELLAVFWENHDPTQRNRQGPDGPGCFLPEAGAGLPLGTRARRRRQRRAGGGRRQDLQPAPRLPGVAGNHLGAPDPDFSPGEAGASRVLHALQHGRQWQ